MKKTQPCNEDVRTLCPRCLAAYRDSGKFNIRHAKGGHVATESCMICGKPNSAVDYIITKKN